MAVPHRTLADALNRLSAAVARLEEGADQLSTAPDAVDVRAEIDAIVQRLERVLED